MDVVSLNFRDERLVIDRDPVLRLCQRLGPAAADASIEAALEELAFWLYHCAGTAEGCADAERQRSALRRVDRLARMTGLASVADVATRMAAMDSTVSPTDRAAIAARLIRLGERSILALWDLNDMTL